jgi:hypothetical protein
MKKIVFALFGFAFVVGWSTLAGDAPRGSLLELHSCELYAGGCVVSSEATLGGRYMLRAWNFTGGGFAGAEFAGLRVALLQTSSENLAAEKTSADRSVVYLPQDATRSQREALAAWLKSALPELKSTRLRTRVVPLQVAGNGSGYTLSASEFLSVRTAGLESCETGACGESLWYEPRTPTTVFTVALDRSSRVAEPLLKLKWNDGGKRSVFLGKFGDTGATKREFVTASDWCGPANRAF